MFPFTQNYYLSKLLFSPDATQSSRILLSKEVHNAFDYHKCIRQFTNRAWPHALLRFTILDELPSTFSLNSKYLYFYTFSLAHWNTHHQTQRHLDLPLPTWLVLVNQCLYLIGQLCRHSWNLLFHSKCPWMSTLWWPSHLGATRMVARSILLCLCRSISYPHKPIMLVAQCRKERLRLKLCYTTSRRTSTA